MRYLKWTALVLLLLTSKAPPAHAQFVSLAARLTISTFADITVTQGSSRHCSAYDDVPSTTITLAPEVGATANASSVIHCAGVSLRVDRSAEVTRLEPSSNAVRPLLARFRTSFTVILANGTEVSAGEDTSELTIPADGGFADRFVLRNVPGVVFGDVFENGSAEVERF